MIDFRPGDAIQLICTTAWHKKGDIAEVDSITSELTMNVYYEGEDKISSAIKQNFRKINLNHTAHIA